MAFVTDDTAMLYFLGTTGEETAGAFELESGLLLEDASATVGFGITVEGSLTTPGCTFLNGVDSFDASPELTETEERALPTFETTFLKLEELELAEEIENLFEMVSLCKELIENLFVFTELPLSSLKLSIDHLLLWLLWTLDLFFFDKFDEEVLGSEGLLDSITDCLFSCAVTLEFGTLFNSCRIDLRLRSIFATCFFFIQKLLGLITEFIVQLLVRYSNEFHKVKLLKQDRYDTNIAKNKLSPQDQYAKWTKLNRKVDQLNSEIDTAEKALQAKKDQLSSSTTLLKRLITLLGFLIKIWYRKTKVFYMPNVLPIDTVCYGIWVSRRTLPCVPEVGCRILNLGTTTKHNKA